MPWAGAPARVGPTPEGRHGFPGIDVDVSARSAARYWSKLIEYSGLTAEPNGQGKAARSAKIG